MKAGNSALLAAKMVIKNPEEVNAVIVNGEQSNENFHRVTGHAGHHLMDATAKYDTIPTRNGRELGEIWVSKVGTNF